MALDGSTVPLLQEANGAFGGKKEVSRHYRLHIVNYSVNFAVTRALPKISFALTRFAPGQ